jgi:alkylmercury lyase
MRVAPPTIEELSAQLARARPALDEQEQCVAIALYRMLAEGRPVARGDLARRAGVTTDDAASFLDEHPGVHLDDRGRVVGFSGMALTGMAHRLEIDGHQVCAWCAWDTLFLPELLGATVEVSSRCPTTGEAIRLRVGPDGVHGLVPANTVLSFLRPTERFGADTIRSFCHFVHFFASRRAAEPWIARHPGTFVLSIEDGFELGRRMNRATFGASGR